jgi:hypothetical protein
MFKLNLVLITVFAYTINDQMSFARVFWTLRYPFYTTEETLFNTVSSLALIGGETVKLSPNIVSLGRRKCNKENIPDTTIFMILSCQLCIVYKYSARHIPTADLLVGHMPAN